MSVDIGKWETRKISAKNCSTLVDGARQKFKFFRQNICFLENNGALFKFLSGILHCQIMKKSDLKTQFYMNHESQLHKNQII